MLDGQELVDPILMRIRLNIVSLQPYSMTPLERRLRQHQKDFTAETGHPFKNFTCPITLRDEPTRLCLGHVINQAFSRSSRCQLVQRADVDSFFGSRFESDFVKLRHKGRHRLDKYLTDQTLGKEIASRFRLQGKEIEYYYTAGAPSPQHTELPFPGLTPGRRLVLKIHPSELVAGGRVCLNFGIEADLRVPMFVSVLKAAHLTLFNILGYRHALALSGRFLGHDLLGALFWKFKDKPKSEVPHATWADVKRYASMVRPLQVLPPGFRGTISDNSVLVCRTAGSTFWGIVVFIRTGIHMQAVVTPVFDTDAGVGRYFEFLSSNGQHFEVTKAVFKDGAWQLSPNWFMVNWPRTDLPS